MLLVRTFRPALDSESVRVTLAALDGACTLGQTRPYIRVDVVGAHNRWRSLWVPETRFGL
jgi:hypothetical protein